MKILQRRVALLLITLLCTCARAAKKTSRKDTRNERLMKTRNVQTNPSEAGTRKRRANIPKESGIEKDENSTHEEKKEAAKAEAHESEPEGEANEKKDSGSRKSGKPRKENILGFFQNIVNTVSEMLRGGKQDESEVSETGERTQGQKDADFSKKEIETALIDSAKYAKERIYEIGGELQKKWSILSSIGVSGLFEPNPVNPMEMKNTQRNVLVMFIVMFGLGCNMVVWGENNRFFNCSVLVFLYFYSLFLEVSKKLIDHVYSLDISSEKINAVLTYQPFKHMLSCFFCLLFGAVLMFAFKMFFRTAAFVLAGWVFFIGPGRNLVHAMCLEMAVGMMVLGMFALFFIIKRCQRKALSIIMRLIFGFFGSSMILFAISESFHLGMYLPRIVFNYMPFKETIPNKEEIVIGASSLISALMQSKKPRKKYR